MNLFSRRVRRAVTGSMARDLSTPTNTIAGLIREQQRVGAGTTDTYTPDSFRLSTVPLSEQGNYRPVHAFGERSRKVRSELDPRLQKFCNAVANHWDVSLIEGYRSPERQLELYNSGASKVRVGKHNTSPSRAVDMAPYPIDWNDIDQFIRFTYFAKGLIAAMNLPIKNGADWDEDNDYADHTFLDWVHWELTLMTNEQHLHNIHALPTNRAKLEYCVDNQIFAATCSPEILEVLEDIRDEVRGYDPSQIDVDPSYEIQGAVVRVERETPNVILGMDRRPLPKLGKYEIDNLGNVFNSRGGVCRTFFMPKKGGLMIRDTQRTAGTVNAKFYLVAKLMLETFLDEELPDKYRVLYRDRDISNLNINNLTWISA